MAEPNGDKIGSTAERVRATERDLGRHQGAIDQLYEKGEDNNRGQWKALGVVAGLLIAVAAGLGGSLLSPINTDLGDLRREVRALRTTNEEQGRLLSAHGVLIDQNTKTVDVFRGLMRRVEDERVPRVEYTKDWAANGRDLATIQRQIDDTNKKLDAIAPPRDWFQDLLRRLAALEQQRPKAP